MASMYSNYKKWLASINKAEFDGLERDIKEKTNLEDDNCQKYLLSCLKSLAYVCFDNEKAKSQGKTVAKIMSTLVKGMTVTEDCLKPMFFMVKYLLKEDMISETRQICDHLIEHRTNKFEESFIMICKAWEKCMTDLIENLRAQFSRKLFQTFLTVMEHYFLLLKQSTDSHGKYIFRSLLMCLTTMESVFETSSKHKPYIDFVKAACSQLLTLHPQIHKSIKLEIEPKLFTILGKITFHLILTDNTSKTEDLLDQVSRVLLRVLSGSENLPLMRTQLKVAKALIKPPSEITGSTLIVLTKNISSESTLCIPWLESLLYYWYTKNARILQDCPLEILNLVFTVSQKLKIVDHVPCCPGCAARKDKTLQPSLKLRTMLAKILQHVPLEKINTQLFVDFLTSCVSDILELKVGKCTNWFSTWTKIKNTLCFFAQSLSKIDIDNCITLYCTLCSGIANLEDFETSDSTVSIASVLTKIACAYYHAPGHSQEALTSAAFAAVYNFETENHKCFRIWNGIKQREPQQFKSLTMLECLRTNGCWIEDLGIKMDLAKYNLADLCILEIVSHLEGSVDMTDLIVQILDEIDQLDRNYGLQYARGVQILAFYIGKRNIRKNLTMFAERARKKLEKEKDCLEKNCLLVSLQFCGFLDSLNDNKRVSETDIKIHDRLMNLNKKKSEDGSLNSDKEKDEEEVAASFAAIGVEHDEILVEKLTKVLQNWREFFLNDFEKLVEIWEPKYLMEIIMLGAEYAKLYGYHNCEVLAWKMALKLAGAVKDDRNYVRVVSYLMAARFIRTDWIDKAENLTVTLEKSATAIDVRTARMFQLQLSDYYLKLGKLEEALKLLQKLHQDTNLNNMSRESLSGHLQLMVKSILNYKLLKPNASHQEYSTDLLIARYGVINLSYYLEPSTACPMIAETSPFISSIFFDAISNLYLYMDNEDFRDLHSHLPFYFRIGQNLACTKRIGDLLKILVRIDLNKGDMMNCEIKLSALEKILDIELKQPKQSSVPKKVEMKVPKVAKTTDLIRDASCHYIRTGSIFPELQKQTLRYTKPNFLSHKSKCNCYKCKSLDYQSLVFAATSLRARFYKIDQNLDMALQYYKGAYEVRRVFAQSEFHYIKSKENNIAVKSFWCNTANLVDWVLFLLSYCKFLKLVGETQNVMEIAMEALDICESRLSSHIVHNKVRTFVNEFQHFKTNDFTIPTDEDVADLLEGLPSFSPRITMDRSPVLEQRKKLEKTKRAPPVNHRKKSPKQFGPTKPSLKVALQDTFIKSPPPIFTDETETETETRPSRDKIKLKKETLIKPPSPISIDDSSEGVQSIESQSSSQKDRTNQKNGILQEAVNKSPPIIVVHEPKEDVQSNELLKENLARVTTRRTRATRRVVNYAESPQAEIVQATEMFGNLNLASAEDKKPKKKTRSRRKISEEPEDDMFADEGTSKPKPTARKRTQAKDAKN